MNLIERYIFRRTLLFSLSAFASLILVVWAGACRRGSASTS